MKVRSAAMSFGLLMLIEMCSACWVEIEEFSAIFLVFISKLMNLAVITVAFSMLF